MSDKEIDWSQRRLEHLFTKAWLMEGVVCLSCKKPWSEWTDKVRDQCGCEESKLVNDEKSC